MVSARFLCVAIQTSIHCIYSDHYQSDCSSLFVKEDFHHSVFVITSIIYVSGFVLRHMANVITRCVTWKVITPAVSQVSFTSADVIFLCYERCRLPSLIVHETTSLPVSSCFICQLMDSLIFHFTTVDWQAPFIFSITFFVNQTSHSLMLSCNFTLHSCSYRRPSICN